MKKIKTVDGEVINGYEYSDLNNDAKKRVLSEQIDFEIEIMDEESPYYYCAIEMERMRTPWFLGEMIYEKHKNDLIETIEINKYLFNKHGKMLSIIHYVNANNITEKITFEGTECELINL